MSFTSYFSRPRHVQAVKWDGNEDTLKQLGVDFRKDCQGKHFILMTNGMLGYAAEDFWILKNSAGDILKPLPDAEFKEKYVKQQAHGQMFIAEYLGGTQSELEGKHIP